jgi:hypothetical protein
MPNSFWTLRDDASLNKLAEWANEIETEKVICPVDPGHQRGGKRLTDLSVVLPRGTVKDFVWTWYSECLIQDGILQLFRRESFSGFEAKPVKARFKKNGDVPPTLWELVVTGWGGLARTESGIKRTYYCEVCKQVNYSGLTDAQKLIDESQWDGSDFFMVWPMPLFIFVTERVADCLRDHRLSGAVLKQVCELSGIGKDGMNGGRLS